MSPVSSLLTRQTSHSIEFILSRVDCTNYGKQWAQSYYYQSHLKGQKAAHTWNWMMINWMKRCDLLDKIAHSHAVLIFTLRSFYFHRINSCARMHERKPISSVNVLAHTDTDTNNNNKVKSLWIFFLHCYWKNRAFVRCLFQSSIQLFFSWTE